MRKYKTNSKDKTTSKKLNILQILDVDDAAGNGVADAVKKYVEYEGASLWCINDTIKVPDSITTISSRSKTMHDVISEIGKPDLVIFNEVYKKEYLRLYKECIKNSIPYVIIPHGCLMRKAQKKSKLKKKVANLLLFNRFINHSLAIQYLNDREKDESIIKKQKFIVSGNGVDIADNKNSFKNKDFVYIGRYSIKIKGLDLVVKMVSDNKEWFMKNKVKIQLYGRCLGNCCEKMRKLVSKNNVSDIIIVNDAIYGEDKNNVLLQSYAFIYPSRHEGHPMSVLEALSFGVPCIVTVGTSFSEYVNENGCGIGIMFDEKALFSAVKRMFEDEDFRSECAKNTIVVERDYSWRVVIKKSLKEYESLLCI